MSGSSMHGRVPANDYLPRILSAGCDGDAVRSAVAAVPTYLLLQVRGSVERALRRAQEGGNASDARGLARAAVAIEDRRQELRDEGVYDLAGTPRSTPMRTPWDIGGGFF